MQRSILYIENDPSFLKAFRELLEYEGYRVRAATTIAEAKEILRVETIQLIITDLRVTDDSDYHDMSGLSFARTIAPAIPKIIFTAFSDFEAARTALRVDSNESFPAAVNFISKSEGIPQIVEAINKAFQQYVRSDYTQFKTGGALTDVDAAVYVRRQAEREILDLLKGMEYLLVIEPRQQGKTSLINYLSRHPELSGTVFIYIDIATIDGTSVGSWYRSLCLRITAQLKSAKTPVDRTGAGSWYRSLWLRVVAQLKRGVFHQTLPPIAQTNQEWRDFLSGLALVFESRKRNLVIALDEIGSPIPDATGFFSILRDVFNSRQAEPHFRNLTFLLTGAFHPRDLVGDSKLSPFNIAHRVRLPDFTVDQISRLVTNIVPSFEQADALAARIYFWTSGQPYLTQRICTYLGPGSTADDVDVAIERLRREDENHLPPILKRLDADKIARSYVERLLGGEKIRFFPTENSVQAQLEILGVIKADFDGYCVLRNRLYVQLLGSAPLNTSATLEPGSANPHSPERLAELATKDKNRQEKIESSPDRTTSAGFSDQTIILFLAADPTDASRLRLGQELREIQEKLRMSEMRTRFKLSQRMSVRPADLSQAILDENPQIIHFSGHGTSAGALCFEDELGMSKEIGADALGSLFELVADQVNCVLMNACYSAVQAEAIVRHIRFVIGMDKAIGDQGAISFAIGFYQALGAGKSIEDAYRFGCVQIKLNGIPEHLTPVLLRKTKQ